MNKGVLTTQEFAEKSGVTSSTVAKWIRNGRINATKQGGKWVIPADQLASNPDTSDLKDATASTPASSNVSPQGTKEKYYTVEEFSAMTYLTPFGVDKWLKEGRLNGIKNDAGQWQVAASNLGNSNIKHLLRN